MTNEEVKYNRWADRWCWRNLREMTVSLHIAVMPWQWRIYAGSPDGNNYLGAYWTLQFGPFIAALSADIGNNSTGNWRSRFGLSMSQAWERLP